MLVAKGFQHEPLNYSVRTLQQRRGKVSVCAGGNESQGNMLSEAQHTVPTVAGTSLAGSCCCEMFLII